MNKQTILKQMEAVVKDVMTRNTSDFYVYDTDRINGMTEDQFSFIWVVSPLSTHMETLDFAKWFTPENALYWDYLRDGELPHEYLWASWMFDTTSYFFVVTADGLQRIEHHQTREVVRDFFLPCVEKARVENGGKLPEYKKLDIEYDKGVEELLRIFINDCRAHGDDSLQKELESIKNEWRVHINEHRILNWDPWEKQFNVYKNINGYVTFYKVVKFHGWPETGYEENGSVQLVPKFGWAHHS